MEQREYDEESGNCVMYTYYDYEGNRMENEIGYASEKLIYDEKGQVIHKRRREQNELLTTGTDYAMDIDMEYDARGNIIREVYDYNPAIADGQRVFQPFCYGYDTRDNRIMQCLMGDEGELYANENGTAVVEWKYDERDRKVQTAYYDAEKNLINEAEGYAVEEYSYDAYNHLSEVSRYAVAGGEGEQSLALSDRFVYTYDVYGHETEVRHYDSHGALLADSDGIAYTVKDYDIRGNIIRKTYFDKDGVRTVCPDGYAIVETIYDAAGRALQYSYYDKSGMPMTQESGFPARETLALHERGDVRERIFYNEKGEFFQMKEGYPRNVYAYDRQGEEAALWHYDCENRLADAQVRVVYIEAVEPGSKAYLAGMRESDIILQYGDWEFWGDEDFQDSILSEFQSVRHVNSDGYLSVRIYREDGDTFHVVIDAESNTMYGDAGVGTKNLREYLFEDDFIGVQTGVMWMDMESVTRIREQYESLFAGDHAA